MWGWGGCRDLLLKHVALRLPLPHEQLAQLATAKGEPITTWRYGAGVHPGAWRDGPQQIGARWDGARWDGPQRDGARQDGARQDGPMVGGCSFAILLEPSKIPPARTFNSQPNQRLQLCAPRTARQTVSVGTSSDVQSHAKARGKAGLTLGLVFSRSNLARAGNNHSSRRRDLRTQQASRTRSVGRYPKIRTRWALQQLGGARQEEEKGGRRLCRTILWLACSTFFLSKERSCKMSATRHTSWVER